MLAGGDAAVAPCPEGDFAVSQVGLDDLFAVVVLLALELGALQGRIQTGGLQNISARVHLFWKNVCDFKHFDYKLKFIIMAGYNFLNIECQKCGKELSESLAALNHSNT